MNQLVTGQRSGKDLKEKWGLTHCGYGIPIEEGARYEYEGPDYGTVTLCYRVGLPRPKVNRMVLGDPASPSASSAVAVAPSQPAAGDQGLRPPVAPAHEPSKHEVA